MDFKVLGPIQVVEDGQTVDLGPLKQRAVLAFLLMNAGRVVTTDQVLDAVWGEDSSGKENALWVTISRLRSALNTDQDAAGDQIIVTRDHGYALDIDPNTIDAHRFEQDVASVRESINLSSTQTIEDLRAALSLWLGDAYADVEYEEFAQSEIRRLDAVRESATEALFEARLDVGSDAQLVDDLEQYAAQFPFRETPIRLLMTALYRSGRQADALKTYRAFAALVGEELGIEPSPELRRLEEQVLLHDMGVASHAIRGIGHHGNPFKGLQVFREEDAASFFGRSSVITRLVQRIGDGLGLITLVGASGSGKSSIVRAGLIPALRKRSLPDSDQWLIATMVPGSHPFVELETALLRSSLDAPSSLKDQLTDTRTGILRAVLRVLPDENSRLILVIDQLEELFTLTQDQDDATRFLEGLVEAISDPKGRVVVVATLRADFYAQILGASSFGTAMGDGVINIVPLLPDELEEAALRPAELAGATIEPSLLGALISDVLGRPGSLPLFQYALTDLYEHAADGRLILENYREMGGLTGSLTNRAETLYEALTASEKHAAQQLFLRLVTIAEGDEWGRRRANAAELLSLNIDTLDLQKVADSFVTHRLLTVDRDPTSGDPTIEVAHEALLTEWDRLQNWISDARQDLRKYAAFSTAVTEWQAADRHEDYLWTGRRLADYETWAANATIDLNQADLEFLSASVENRTKQQFASRAEEQTRRRRVLGLVGAVGGVSIIIALLVTGWFSPTPKRVLLITFEEGIIAGQMINGLEQAARDFNIDADILSPLSDFDGEVRAALASSPDLVIFGLDEAATLAGGIEPLAMEHPDVHFVLLGGWVLDSPDNVSYATFNSEDGSYLVGIAAAMKSETGVVGFVGGLPSVVDSFRAGFEQGAMSVENTTVLSTTILADPERIWRDPEAAVVATELLLEEGADVVFHASGNSGLGVFQAVAEASGPTHPVWAIGVDADEGQTAPLLLRDFILTSMVKKHDAGVYLAVENFLAGETGDLVLDLDNGGVGYSDTGGHLDSETIEALEAAGAEIIDGSADVRPWTLEPETTPPSADVVVELQSVGPNCSSPTPESHANLGDVIRVNATNNSDESIAFYIAAPGQFGFNNTFLHPGGRATLSSVAGSAGVWTIGCASPASVVTAIELDVRAALTTNNMTVIFDGQNCTAETDRPVVIGDTVNVTFRNTSQQVTHYGIARLPLDFEPNEVSVSEHSLANYAEEGADPGEDVNSWAAFREEASWAAFCFVPATEKVFDTAIFTVGS